MDNIVREGEQFVENRGDQGNDQTGMQGNHEGNQQEQSNQQDRQVQPDKQGGGMMKNIEQNAGDAYVNQGMAGTPLADCQDVKLILVQESTGSSGTRVSRQQWMVPSMAWLTPKSTKLRKISRLLLRARNCLAQVSFQLKWGLSTESEECTSFQMSYIPY